MWICLTEVKILLNSKQLEIPDNHMSLPFLKFSPHQISKRPGVAYLDWQLLQKESTRKKTNELIVECDVRDFGFDFKED